MRARVLAAAVLCVGVAGCGSERAATTTQPPPQPRVAASCILAVELGGRRYIGSAVADAPPLGDSLGTATVPGCNDTPGAVEPAPDQQVEVSEIAGVDPDVAIAWRERTDVVLIREDVDPAKLPPRLAKLVRGDG